MTGVLLVDKPQGFTSFDVVAKVRGIARERKIGHGGTLDPMATGVLPLFLGGATKACDMLPCQDKEYLARLRLGQVTDTQDSTGTLLEEHPVDVGARQVEQALAAFRGQIMQVPPMYSAVHVNGRRLYDLAREGRTVERQARPITVYEARLESADQEKGEYAIRVRCSKGAYIRTICHDLGQALGCGAVMTALRRTSASGYGLEQCRTLEEIQQAADENRLEELLLPLASAFSALPRVELDQRRARLFRNGVGLDLARNGLPRLMGQYAVYGPGGAFLGVAHNDYEKNQLQLDKQFPER